MYVHPGETLLFIACSSEKEKDLVEQIRYLVKEKGADCTLVDSSGNTPVRHSLVVAFSCLVKSLHATAALS